MARIVQQQRGKPAAQRSKAAQTAAAAAAVLPGKPLRREVNEALLLHGTQPGALLSMLANGLNERFSGTNAGAAFGNGAYLAEDLGKADQYAALDSQYDHKSDLHQRLYDSSQRHPGRPLPRPRLPPGAF